MFKRILLITVLSLLATTSSARGKDNSFCRGFIVKALDTVSVEGVPKIDLWLGWNAVVVRTGFGNKLNQTQYQAGRDFFDQHYAAGDAEAIEDMRDDDCDMGRN